MDEHGILLSEYIFPSNKTNKETYLKDLMDSFPRDQGGHINANVALRASNLAHMRIKRS